MDTLLDELRELIAKAIRATGVEKAPSEIHVEHPAIESHGDYATNVAMILAKELKESPLTIAEKIVAHLPASPRVRQVEAVRPGFINFRLADTFFWTEAEKILSAGDNYGARPNPQPTRVLVEHTQINPNKEPHIGHLRNACIGDSLVALYRFRGYNAKALYYQNDVGQQIASILLAEQKQFLRREDFPSLIAWASSAYSDIDRRIAENPELQKEKEAIQIRIAEQNTKEAERARNLTDQILRETFEILAELGMEYDLIVRESDILKNKFWEKAFQLMQTKPAFYLAETGERAGCWMIKMPEGTEDKIIVRSNGIPTYAGNDIANHLWKFGILNDFRYEKLEWGTQSSSLYVTATGSGEERKDFVPADSIVNVIDQTQTYPQQSVIESLRILGFAREAENYYHVNYGFVYLSRKTAEQLGIPDLGDAKQVKISGRQGTVVSVPTFLRRMEEMLAKEHGQFETIKQVRNGAIKFELLKYNTYQDVIFDLDAALDIRGMSGPYVQYAYTRATSILKKSADPAPQALAVEKLSDDELSLLRKAVRLPEIIELALKELGPHHLCLYLYELAQEFNGFYERNRIIGSDREKERLLIVRAVQQVLENGLRLLGIQAPEVM